MSVSLSLTLEQLKTLVGQCTVEEKIELARFLETQTFEFRFKRLLGRLRAEELTLEEITEEVEAVRQKRYEQVNSSGD